MRHLLQCRTAALGGHVDECDACGHRRISYNSCRDRHCPKCQAARRAEWLHARLDRLLPVQYFHVVFTLPEEINPLAIRNKRLLFNILFAAASRTLRQLARDDKHLGAQIGFTAVLHTWGRNLLFHPHLHCVVTGGGLSPDGERWVAGRRRFFLPVKVLGRLFRGKFLHALDEARRDGRIEFPGRAAELAGPAAWRNLLDTLYGKDWVVYSKPPFGGPERVFRYLGQYTHRVAISNHRIAAFEKGKVTFVFKDHASGGKEKRLTLDAVEFIRRFLLHVLPKGLVRIRHYGLYAGRNVRGKLEHARRLLSPEGPPPRTGTPPVPARAAVPWWQRLLDLTGVDVMACPCCHTGRLVRRPLPGLAPALVEVACAAIPDTS